MEIITGVLKFNERKEFKTMKDELKFPAYFYQVLKEIKELGQEKHELRKILFNDFYEKYEEAFAQEREIEMILFSGLLRELDYERELVKNLKKMLLLKE